jgi:Flp pilus assembly protein TadD
MSLSRDAEAEVQFRAALELNPNDRRILENLDLVQKRRANP